jgi:hypothetical protein
MPPGCCKIPGEVCTSIAPGANIFTDGCVEKLIDLLENIGILLGALAIAVGVVEVRTHSAYGGVTRHLELLAINSLHRLRCF